jgi:hypothetical protein
MLHSTGACQGLTAFGKGAPAAAQAACGSPASGWGGDATLHATGYKAQFAAWFLPLVALLACSVHVAFFGQHCRL